MILLFNKPYGVLSQFTPDQPGQRTLTDFGFPKNVYPVGRLDMDSEGLLILTDEKEWNDRLLNPKHAHGRIYHVQVEGEVDEKTLKQLEGGVMIQNYKTLPCRARQLIFSSERLAQPATNNMIYYPERNPPVRFRKNIPTSWIELELNEGKNRQVRRMTAAVGFPTLRLIRVRIAGLKIESLAEGKWREIKAEEIIL